MALKIEIYPGKPAPRLETGIAEELRGVFGAIPEAKQLLISPAFNAVWVIVEEANTELLERIASFRTELLQEKPNLRFELNVTELRGQKLADIHTRVPGDILVEVGGAK